MNRSFASRSHRKILASLLLALAMLNPTIARAQDEDSKIYDARLEGYSSNVTLESRSTALMWVLILILSGACVGVLFMNAKRSHLD